MSVRNPISAIAPRRPGLSYAGRFRNFGSTIASGVGAIAPTRATLLNFNEKRKLYIPSIHGAWIYDPAAMVADADATGSFSEQCKFFLENQFMLQSSGKTMRQTFVGNTPVPLPLHTMVNDVDKNYDPSKWRKVSDEDARALAAKPKDTGGTLVWSNLYYTPIVQLVKGDRVFQGYFTWEEKSDHVTVEAYRLFPRFKVQETWSASELGFFACVFLCSNYPAIFDLGDTEETMKALALSHQTTLEKAIADAHLSFLNGIGQTPENYWLPCILSNTMLDFQNNSNGDNRLTWDIKAELAESFGLNPENPDSYYFAGVIRNAMQGMKYQYSIQGAYSGVVLSSDNWKRSFVRWLTATKARYERDPFKCEGAVEEGRESCFEIDLTDSAFAFVMSPVRRSHFLLMNYSSVQAEHHDDLVDVMVTSNATAILEKAKEIVGSLRRK